MKVIITKIKCCGDCPYFDFKRDQKFNAYYIFCKKENNKYIQDNVIFSTNLKNIEIPDWCPLKDEVL